MSQLRSDLALAFETARARVQSYAINDGDLLEAIRRLINAPMRFVEPCFEIQEPQAHMATCVEALQVHLASVDEVGPAQVGQIRREACEAVEALQRAVFEHGCASAAADRVGLGVQGKRI